MEERKTGKLAEENLTEGEKELWDKMNKSGWWRWRSLPRHREVFHELKTRIEREEKKDESR